MLVIRVYDLVASGSISDLLKEGQEIIVQIAKEPLGQKGARITSHIALPGRFLVYMPTVDHIGVSRKIPSDEERSRLKRVLQTNRTGIPGGYIVRTAGEGRTEEELRADMMFLYNLWLDMRQKAERRPAPVLIHHDLNVVERMLRDQLTAAFKSIWVDNEEALRERAALRAALPAGAGEPGEAVHARRSRSSTSSASPPNWRRRCGRRCG